MRNFVLLINSVWLMASAYAIPDATQYAHDFWLPRYHKQRLAYCLPDKKTCGKTVADRYCQKLGYLDAQRATIDHNVGITGFLDQEKSCRGWACDGFKLIRCYGKALHQPRRSYYYRYKKFALPRMRHYRIDWCYDQTNCGQPAAYSFCRYMGYKSTTRYTSEAHLAATRALGNQKLCFGDCNGFASITCYR